MSCLSSSGALISPVETTTTLCDAHRCRINRFKGSEVDWVQCDGCDRWIHLFCVGLKAGEVKKMKEFYCEFCN